MTHPFHPLPGRAFELFTTRIAWGEERVYFKDARGEIRSLPSAWTDAATPDPFVVVAAGRSAVRLEDLLRMVDVLARRRG